MQILIDSLRGAFGFVLIFLAVVLIAYFVLMLPMPSRDNIEAYYAMRSRQNTVMFGGLLMLVTVSGFLIFSIAVWKN